MVIGLGSLIRGGLSDPAATADLMAARAHRGCRMDAWTTPQNPRSPLDKGLLMDAH